MAERGNSSLPRGGMWVADPSGSAFQGEAQQVDDLAVEGTGVLLRCLNELGMQVVGESDVDVLHRDSLAQPNSAW